MPVLNEGENWRTIGSAAGSLRLDGPPVIDHVFALAFPEVYDLPVLLGSALAGLIPTSADFIMGIEVQAAAELNRARKFNGSRRMRWQPIWVDCISVKRRKVTLSCLPLAVSQINSRVKTP